MVASSSIIDRNHASFTRPSSVIDEVLVGLVVTVNTSDKISDTFYSLDNVMLDFENHTSHLLLCRDTSCIIVLALWFDTGLHFDTSNKVVIDEDMIIGIKYSHSVLLTSSDDIISYRDVLAIRQINAHAPRILERASLYSRLRHRRVKIGELEVNGW